MARTRKLSDDQPSLFDAPKPKRAIAPVQPCGVSHRVAGLFAGIGGLERGLHQAGHHCELLCEIDEGARAVLATHFPAASLSSDVRELSELPSVDLLVGGFPCQDLSQAGKTAGIEGTQSGLVGEVFRLIDAMKAGPRWLLLENVPFMLHLEKGKAMAYLSQRLEEMGFRWAYRTVDTRAFGLPQRRQRVLLLASRAEDPCSVLFADEAGERGFDQGARACGFYWTEGVRGLGWAIDAVPTLKGGSTVGIPSPPAIWMRDEERIVTPEIRDAERLQGFPADWTLPAVLGGSTRTTGRWKLVGNAVSVPVAEWIGRRLASPGEYDDSGDVPLQQVGGWPGAAYSKEGRVFQASVSLWPKHAPYQHLADFLQYPVAPLSERATAGFLARAERSRLLFPDGLLEALRRHLANVGAKKAS